MSRMMKQSTLSDDRVVMVKKSKGQHQWSWNRKNRMSSLWNLHRTG